MKRITIVQRFFAHGWPAKLWIAAWVLGSLFVVIDACEPTLALFSDVRALLSFAAAVVIAPLLGYFLALFVGCIVLPPVYELRERLNGGPFKPGDTVRILVGPYAGRITQVESSWQGRAYRVNLGPEERESFKDVLEAANLRRERSAEPSPPACPGGRADTPSGFAEA